MGKRVLILGRVGCSAAQTRMKLIAESYEDVMFGNSFNLIPAEISRIKEICCVSIPFGVELNRSGDIDAYFCGPRKMDKLIGWSAVFGIDGICCDLAGCSMNPESHRGSF